MFQKLLQKILKDIIGEFTQQIDTNNLSVGIWSGEIQINRVKLNKNLFKKFNLPINVVFSFINELKIKIPWKSFFSSPLIISIDSVWGLCTIDEGQIPVEQQKHALINSLKLIIANLGKKMLQKLKPEQDKQSSYIDNILLKMFDNLYLNIKNIHFRFEHQIQKFSFGLVIDAIDIHAVDEKNKAIFVDRNKLKENDKAIRRKFSLEKLRLYWEPNEKQFLILKQLKQKQQFFKNSQNLLDPNKYSSLIYILYLDIQGLIIENYTEREPFYDVRINQQKIQLNLKKQIIEQFLFLTKSLQQILRKIKSTKIIETECSAKTYRFLRNFSDNYLADKDSKLSQKQKDQKLAQMFKVNHEQIMQLIHFSHDKLIQTVDNIVLNEIGQQKLLKGLDLKQIDLKKILQKQTKQEIKTTNSKIRVSFILPKALVYLFSYENKPVLQLNLSNTEVIYLIQNAQSKITLNMGSISVLGEENCQLFRLNRSEKQKHSLTFAQTVKDNKTSIELYITKINVLYDPKVILSIVTFFTFTLIDSKMKNQALDKLQKIESDVTSQFRNVQQQVTLKIVIDGFSTIFIHPIHQLMIESKEIRLFHGYEGQSYNFQTQNVSMKVLKNNIQTREIKIIEPFNLIVNYEIEKSQTLVDIPDLKVSIDREIYLFLMQFSKIFSGEGKKEMLMKADIVGEIFIKENRWKKTLSMIHNGKIYLWDEDDIYPKSKLRIRKAKQMSKGKLNYIIIGDKTNDIQIAFKTQKEYNSWKEQIENIVEFSTKSERKSSRMSSVIEHKPKENKTNSSLQFKLKNFNIELKEENSKNIVFFLKDLKYESNPNRVRSQDQEKLLNFQQVSLHSLQIQFEGKRIFNDIQKECLPFLKCMISENSESSEIVSQIEVEINSFQLNFDPLFLIKINSFFRKENVTNTALYMIKSQQTLDKQDQEKILSRHLIKLKQSTVNFINKKTRTLLCFLSFQTLEVEVKTKYYEYSIDGKAEKVCLGDLTGYPNTRFDKNKQVPQKLVATNILCSEKNLANSINFRYFMISEGSSRYNQKKKEILSLSFNNFRLNLIYQVFFRIFDYIFVQLIGSISYPEFFDEFLPQTEVKKEKEISEVDFKKFTTKKDELIRSKALAKMDKKQLQDYLIHGVFFYLQLKFTNSTINLVSEDINEGLHFIIKSIQMENDFIFHPIDVNSTKCQLLSQLYEIKMSEIMINVTEKEEKTMVTPSPLSLKINIEMFNKDLQYNYLYGENQAFTSKMSVIVDIEPCKLSFRTENIFSLKKIITYNLAHDDGLDFLMIYDYMDLVPEMKVNLKLISDIFIFQLVDQEEKITIDSGNFTFMLENTQKISQIHAQCLYFVVGYALMDQYEEVLTSRKNFGKFQPRKTSFRNFISSFQIEKQNNQSILLFQMKTNKQNKSEDCFISIQEVMVIFNSKFLLMLKKISTKNELIIPIEKVYKESKEIKVQNEGGQNKMKVVLNANKVLFCCKFPHSNDMILALLFTCKFKQNKEEMMVFLPHLESFVTNQQQISGQNVDLIKKRTILRPTQVKFNDLEDQTKFFIDRIFLKISVNDMQQLFSLYQDVTNKLNELSDNEKSSNRCKSSMKSLQNESLNSYEKSKSLINVKPTKAKIFELNSIQLMIINDIQQNLIPLIYGNINPQYESISNSIKLQFKFDFFNIRNSFWQPLIETTKLLIKLQPEFRIKMQEIVDFSLEIPTRENRKEYKQFINLNLSTNFIQNFYKTISNKSINFTKLYNPHEEIGIDEINSWVIVNQLGEDIICKSIDQKHEVFIPFNQSAKISYLSNIQQAFNPNKKLQDKERSILINIVVGEKLQFKELNINELGLKKVMFVYKEQRFSLLKNLVVDISKNVRYLTLSSLLEIENSTNLSIRLFVPTQDKYFTLPPQQKRSIPFNLSSDQIILQGISQTQQRQPSMFSLTHSVYAEQNDNVSQERTLQQLQKEKIVHLNFISLKVKTRVERMKKIFSFEPLYLLKNYLPQQMTIVLMDGVQQSMLNQYVISGTNFSQNTSKVGIHPIYHEINDASASFYIEGYQWTNFQLFSGKRKVLLKDFSQRQFQFRIYRDNQESKTSQITFYYPLLLKNKTLSSIKTHSPRFKKSLAKELEKNKSEILFSRQIILEIDGVTSEQVYLRNNTEFFTFRKMVNNLKTFSKYFIFKNMEKINEDVTITEFKIFNKYLVRNDTKNDIILRQVPGKMGEIQTIKRGEVMDLLFFEIESRMSISSMFQFCPKDSEYEWSYPFNLLIANQTTFFIRSRFQFSKLKHYFLEIRKTIESCLEIVFREIDRVEEIPYILVNETQSKEIFLKNVLQNIEPGQSSYFNWQDPFMNCSQLFLQIRDKKKDSKTQKSYTLDLTTKQTSILISSRLFVTNIEVEIIIEPTRKKIVFKDEDVRGSIQKQDLEHLQALIQLPLRISLINNSITPVAHVVDISFNLKLEKFIKGDQLQIIRLQLGAIQVDNQANHNPLYPVILSTEMNFTLQKGKNKTLQIQSKEINLKIEEDFFKSIIQLKSFFENLLKQESTIPENRLSTSEKKSQFFISKLILPRVTIYLEVQTKSFSIETTVNLQKPQVCSFPWKEFPYPIKRIILNIISHLSISPWAFVSSFKKGIQILLTQQSTGRAFQGFFGTLLGAVSNTLGGILGFIVGYDVQKVDNLIDGIDQGVAILFRQLKQIPQFETNACSIGGILQGSGKTLVNIVLKPIKGILRMTLKISEGIKKTAQFSFDQQTYIKTRKPMVFYNHQEYFLPYNREESKYLQRFKQITGNKLQFFYLVKFFPIPLYLDKMDLLLVMSTQYIVVLNLTKRTVLWLVQIAKIVKIQICEICKLRILAIEDGKQEKLVLDSYYGTAMQKKRSTEFLLNPDKKRRQDNNTISRRQLVDTQYEIWMMNENQAIEVIEMYMKVKKSSKILV